MSGLSESRSGLLSLVENLEQRRSMLLDCRPHRMTFAEVDAAFSQTASFLGSVDKATSGVLAFLVAEPDESARAVQAEFEEFAGNLPLMRAALIRARARSMTSDQALAVLREAARLVDAIRRLYLALLKWIDSRGAGGLAGETAG